MSGDGRIPIEVVDAADPTTADPRDGRTAVVLTGGAAGTPADHPLVRHAEAAAAAQAGACACCRALSSLASVLRRLFLDRVHGRVPEFERVVIVTDREAGLREAFADPLVAARYVPPESFPDRS
jgi:hypothetical protein